MNILCVYKNLLTFILAGAISFGVVAQVETGGAVKKRSGSDKTTVAGNASAPTTRVQNLYESKPSHEADLSYMREIYRSVDLTKEKNAALYYPEETIGDNRNLLRIILGAIVNDGLPAYEYLDGKEIFTDNYKINVGEMLDRFDILYSKGKGSTEKNPRYVIEEADYPTTQVLTYYILEKWEYDRLTYRMKKRVEAICPVITRTGDFGGETKYPMFWVKYDALRPYLSRQFVFVDDDNNVPRYSLDDYFTRVMYDGEIYKTKNLRNLSMAQMYPDEDMRKAAQDSIDNRLNSYGKGIWVPTREEYLAQLEMDREAEANIASGDSIPGRTVVSRSVSTKKSNARSKRKSVTRKRARRSTSVSAVSVNEVNPEAEKSVKRRKK